MLSLLVLKTGANHRVTVSQEQFTRCFIEAYCLGDVDLSTFSLPFARLSGEYTIKYMACSVALSGLRSEIYMETDRVRRGDVVKHLERLGARHVVVHSFPKNDQEQLANKFLGRVLERAKKQLTKLYTRGSTNTVPVLERAEEDYHIWLDALRQSEGPASVEMGRRNFILDWGDQERAHKAMKAAVSVFLFCIMVQIFNDSHIGRFTARGHGASPVLQGC